MRAGDGFASSRLLLGGERVDGLTSGILRVDLGCEA